MSSNALPRMPSLLDGFVARLRKTRSPNTVRAYEKIARAFLASEGGQSDADDVEDFVTTARSGAVYATTTRNHRLAALKALAKHAVAQGYWSEDPTRDLAFVEEPSRDPAVLSVGEVQGLFAALERVSAAQRLARDRAMLALLFTLGLRVHELVGLDVHQVDLHSASLIGVRGKGGTVHDLPLEPSTLALLLGWLAERPRHARPGEHAIFLSRLGRRMSTRAVQRFFQKLRAATGTKKKITPHTARHSAATLALLGGADISSIGELLRHADINVTRRYIRLVDTRKRQVAELLSRVIPAPLRQNGSATAAGISTSAIARPASPVPSSDTSRSSAPAPLPPPNAANDNAFFPIDGQGRFHDVG